MPSLSHRVQTFTDSVIRRMTRISDEYGAINLSQGFPDFPPPKPITDALKRIADEGPHQYSVTYGAENFREALARKAAKGIGREIDPEEEVLVTCGGTEAMMSAMMTICNPGDKVVVFSPFYENYGADAILSGADPIFVPLVPPDYHFDASLIEAAFRDEGAKAIIVCNPSNPCGKVFTRDELMTIGELAKKYDAFVVTDEVYEHMVYAPNKHICMASLPGMWERTITCNSLSKTYSITGWRLGWAVVPEYTIEAVDDLATNYYLCAHTPTQHAALACFTPESLAVCEERRQELLARRRIVVSGLERIGLPLEVVPNGAFYAYFSVAGTGLDAWTFCERALEEAHVALTPGRDFGPATADTHVRLSYAASREALTEGLSRLGKFVASLR